MMYDEIVKRDRESEKREGVTYDHTWGSHRQCVDDRAHLIAMVRKLAGPGFGETNCGDCCVDYDACMSLHGDLSCAEMKIVWADREVKR